MHGWAKSGLVRCAMAGQGSQTVARRLRPPCHPHEGGQRAARHGGAGWGKPRRGLAWCGAARAADSSTELLRRLPAALFGGQMWLATASCSTAGYGGAGSCSARHGEARADDLSTGGFGLLCWVLLNPVTARHVAAGLGQLRLGMTWHGMPNADDLSTEGASPP
jgi:hypothetical protein